MKRNKTDKNSPEKGQQVQALVEHLSIELITRQSFPAALTEDIKYRFGALHYAYLMVP
jgi:hypothetical protein